MIDAFGNHREADRQQARMDALMGEEKQYIEDKQKN